MEPTESSGRRGPLGAAEAILRPLWRGTLLVVIAVGGAGLAVAVDRPHNSTQRPELSWRTDQQAGPWIDRLSAALGPLDADIAALSEQAQEILTSITSLELDSVEDALRAGDEATRRIEVAAAELAADRDEAMAALDEWRLGDNTRAALLSLSAAADATQGVPAIWRPLANQAQLVVGLIRDLRDHDDLVVQATSAGRESRWSAALQFLSQAEGRLSSARTARDAIAGQGEVTTLDDVLARYAEYDTALVDLYTYTRDTGNLSGPDFDARQGRVEEAQAELPQQGVMRVIAAETAAQAVAQGLVDIEGARGAILDAQEAVLGPPEATSEPESTGEPEPTSEPLPDFSPDEPRTSADPSLPPA